MQVLLMPRSGTIEIFRPFAMTRALLQTKSGFVMPANAGIHLDSRHVTKTSMDSGLRRNDGSKLSPQVGARPIPRLRAEGWLTRLQGST
jgi:hypothetical protein